MVHLFPYSRYRRSLHLALRTLTLLAVLLCQAAAPAPQVRALNRDASTGPVGPPSFGLNSHLATRYPDPTSMDVPADALVDLGVSWVREDFHWHRVQPRLDVWDFTFTDAAMRAVLTRNIQVLGVLGPSVGWATPYRNDPNNDVSYYAPDKQHFLNYVRGVVTRYRRYVKHWEIWNEPDNAYFWRPAPDPLAYAELLIEASALIKSIDPEAKVLIGGFNSFDTTFVQKVANAGAWLSIDIVAIHPYIDPYSPEDGNLRAAIDGVRTISDRYGERPIWVTEMGWSSGPSERDSVGLTDEQFQASYLVRSMLWLWHAGVERVFWYSFKDDPGSPYGLVRAGSGRLDYGPATYKPAYTALRTLNQQLSGASFVEQIDLFQRDVVLPLEAIDNWRRVSQPNGTLHASTERVHRGSYSARLDYNFTTSGNDYVAFERNEPLALSGNPYALGIWVYGDNSAQGVKIWLRDREGEVLQFVLGTVGGPGWHFISTPIGGPVEPGNRISGNGNGRVDFPAAITAIVLDDVNDAFIGSGTIYLDDISAIQGHEAYAFRFTRNGSLLEMLWSPPRTRAILGTAASNGTLIDRDGNRRTVIAQNAQFRLDLGPAPVYLWHGP
jgi:hypothetical protein